jgi:hypothetical protein
MGKNAQYAILMMFIGALLALLISEKCSRTSIGPLQPSSLDPGPYERPNGTQRLPNPPQIAPQRQRQGGPRSALGVVIQDIVSSSNQDKDGPQVPDGCAVLVSKVLPNSPAASAGIQDGDCIMAFDGKKVENSSQLRTLAEDAGIGKVVRVQAMRGPAPLDVLVTLGVASTPSAPPIAAEFEDARPGAQRSPASCPPPTSWDGNVRGWDKVGSPHCMGATVGFYLSVAINQNKESSLQAIRNAWRIYVEKYVDANDAACPMAEEMVFFDRVGNSGAEILFRRKPDHWDDVRANDNIWLLRDASNQQVDDEVCFFLVSGGRPTPGW